MTPRLALLSAILANPDDDLPRLVFADWLEENGTTDADAARVEFIRLGCKSKAKSRMSAAEGRWLNANWARLLGNTLDARPKGGHSPLVERTGRLVRLKYRWEEGEQKREPDLVFEYVRGFARRVEYDRGYSYQWFVRAVAVDEPLAYHCPKVRELGRPGVETAEHILTEDAWGEDVFRRIDGFDEITRWGSVLPIWDGVDRNSPVKVFRTSAANPTLPATFHPLAVSDAKDITGPGQREWAAVATAMTALARELVGLTEPAG